MSNRINQKMTVSIHILSDLHLEFEDFHPVVTDVDIVILSGDIDIGTRGLSWARQKFPDCEIIYVAGNHEFYRHHYQELLQQFRVESDQYHIHFLEKDELILQGIRFLGCTLWTDYECSEGLTQEKALLDLECRIADHRLIQVDDDDGNSVYFSTRHAWQIHRDSVAWLRRKLLDEQFDGNTVVISHHGPSQFCEHKLFGANELAGAFYSDLPDLMEQADLWIYGHTHSNLDIKINQCRLLSNQKGYPNERVDDFNENLILTI